MQTAAFSTTTTPTHDDHEGYEAFLASIQTRAKILTADGGPLFATSFPNTGPEALFEIFLTHLPAARRQHYTCNACRRFMARFGGLVTLSPEGFSTPLFWDPASVPAFFMPAVEALQRAVSRAPVSVMFLSDEPVWGLPENKSKAPPGVWHHMAWALPKGLIFAKGPLLTAEQVMAEKVQDFETLSRGLTEYSRSTVTQAHALLTGGHLARSEKGLGVAQWLLDLHERLDDTKNENLRIAILWRAVATAPAGFCHVKSSMIGTLLEDVATGMGFEQIKRRWDEKVDPLKYQRPQAPPTAGNIAQAEKVVATLRTAGALERRFARLDDIEALWRPMPPAPPKGAPPAGGVFGHLYPRVEGCAPPVPQPPTVMTWVKFLAEVLPTAERIELYVPYGKAAFSALVTAQNPEAPPILQWDRPEKRNPVSWYVYHGGSEATAWNLKPGTYVEATAVTYQPSMWGDPTDFANQGKSVFFLLTGARDTQYVRGAGFFPELLRTEYHGVRATMEAYAQNAIVAGAAEATACGLKLEAGKAWADALFRVLPRGAGGVTRLYKLDRWD